MPIIFELQTGSSSPLSVQIKSQIELAIARGDLVKGEALLSVRYLAKELKINPNTISKAFQALVQSGSLVSHPGKGYFVASQESRFSEQEIDRQITTAVESFIVATRPLGASRERLLNALKELLPEDGAND